MLSWPFVQVFDVFDRTTKIPYAKHWHCQYPNPNNSKLYHHHHHHHYNVVFVVVVVYCCCHCCTDIVVAVVIITVAVLVIIVVVAIDSPVQHTKPYPNHLSSNDDLQHIAKYTKNLLTDIILHLVEESNMEVVVVVVGMG